VAAKADLRRQTLCGSERWRLWTRPQGALQRVMLERDENVGIRQRSGGVVSSCVCRSADDGLRDMHAAEQRPGEGGEETGQATA